MAMQLPSLPTHLFVHFPPVSSQVEGRLSQLTPTMDKPHLTPAHYCFDKSPPRPEGHNEVGIIPPRTAHRGTHAAINLFTFRSLLCHPLATCASSTCRALQEREVCTAAQLLLSVPPDLLPFSHPPPTKRFHKGTAEV